MKVEEARVAECLEDLGRRRLLRYNSRKKFSFPELKIRIQQLSREDTTLKNYLIL